MKSFFNKWKNSAENNSHVDNREHDEIEASLDRFGFLRSLQLGLTQISISNKKIIFGVLKVLGFILLLAIFLLVHYQNRSVANLANIENKQTTVILRQLDDMNGQLQQLSASPENSKEFQTALVNMVSDLSSIKKSVNDLAKTSDIQKVSNQIITMKTDVDSQMDDLKKELAESSNSKQFLDPKVLPFHVISIDVLSEQPFISIDYAHHITPFAVGDSIAGWRIVAADYSAAAVEFKNDHNQYVKVQLTG